MTGGVDIRQSLLDKILILDSAVWHKGLLTVQIDNWLSNFDDLNEKEPEKCEQLHALHLLSQFMYFGDFQVRSLLSSIFHEFIKYPEIQRIRTQLEGSLDSDLINPQLKESLSKYRYFGVGNPSDSGSFLLYKFRQESGVDKTQFIHQSDIFSYTTNDNKEIVLKIKDDTITNYIFIDDVCGSGGTALKFSKSLIRKMKEVNSELKISYYCMFACKKGLQNVKDNSSFDDVQAVVTLDSTFKCFAPESRHYKNESVVNSTFGKKMALKYGKKIYKSHPLGYKKTELLLGLDHNTPNNTIPILWGDIRDGWQPIFPRYRKSSIITNTI